MPTGIYERKPVVPRMSDCHPNRVHEARGMCTQCYHKALYIQNKRKTIYGIEFPKGFYTYLWLREGGTPYYAGKGSRERAYVNYGHSFHRPISADRIIVQAHSTEEEAFEAEKFLIAYYGRVDLGTGCLRNLTDGGENPPVNKGVKFTEAHKRKISEAQKGPKGHWYGIKRPYRPSGTKGRKQSKEHIANRVASRLRNQEVRGGGGAL